MPVSIVWFKKDLRVQDHAPLVAAARAGDVLPLYIVEPDMWAEPDMAGRHLAFACEAVQSLSDDLARLGQPLVVRFGTALDVLVAIQKTHKITALHSHQETGNDWSFQRDKRVAQWCRNQGIQWHEVQSGGVQRRMKSRKGWAGAWDREMEKTLLTVPKLKPLGLDTEHLPSAQDLSLHPDPCPGRQRAGRKQAETLLASFLTTRAAPYRRAMSSPLSGTTACSRLSPYLTWGCLSMREVAQATWARQAQAKTEPKGPWRGALQSFNARLHWHCHFIQKLEDEPRIEVQHLHPAYTQLRPSEPDAARLQAWTNGETGLPFVDACMRSLRATGWLNFRMRAMLMSVASYHLWLDWRAPGLELARLFTDYEPGIHWPQVQMQAGTTGINTPRIYNPVKQGLDQDAEGVFTRKWVPELAAIDDAYLQTPWKAPNAGRVLGRAYPEPIIDPVAAAKAARDQIWAIRKSDAFRAEAQKIVKKHASRKQPRKKNKATQQMSLPLGDL